MHELSLAQNIVEIVQEALRERPLSRVEKVVVRVGGMVAVIPESLAFCFDAIVDGTTLAGSSLIVEEVPVRVRCRDCETETRVESFAFECTNCGGTKLEMLSGDELQVTHVEIEE